MLQLTTVEWVLQNCGIQYDYSVLQRDGQVWKHYSEEGTGSLNRHHLVKWNKLHLSPVLRFSKKSNLYMCIYMYMYHLTTMLPYIKITNIIGNIVNISLFYLFTPYKYL